MEESKIRIGDKKYLVQVAYTDNEKEQGLQNKTELAEDAGMLFIFDENDEAVSM
jgi:uncharacterized membrane protein (UPF0127 family)